ncbi:DUF3302 domain-containing protein [Variovorax robiniae]|uniref:DUF3302 domain-containing protein n=1 Tax=Variovorax robiniae TaxID=1836199 RepID=A0ABU8XBV2_9BURK
MRTHPAQDPSPQVPATTPSLPRRDRRRRAFQAALAMFFLLLQAPSVHASFLEGEALDNFANILSWVVLALVPCLGIALFWIVHVMPEKIAEKRHHPQKDAIHTLCLLSLVFGGLLWPIAWLWAYTRPVAYKMAYGTEKHEDFYFEHGDKAERGELASHEFDQMVAELDAMERQGHLTPELKRVRENLIAAQRNIAAAQVAESAPVVATVPPVVAPTPPDAPKGA